jgi:CDP-4-dehydro-6-deoxyglucose reductase, E3
MQADSVVTIENTGRSFVCKDEYVLDAALAAGIEVPYNCRGGACGTCKAQVLEGTVQHGWVMGFAITQAEQAEGKCLICSVKPTSDTLRLRMLNQLPAGSAAEAFVPAEYVTTVVAAYSLTQTVRLVTVLLPPDREFRFAAGMYMELVLEEGAARPYSILTSPTSEGISHDGTLTFLIARHPMGWVSGRLHRELLVGGTLHVRGPFGTFRLPAPCPGKVMMLAGGTGIAPLLAMARQALQRPLCGPLELWLSVRTRRDIFCLDELERLARRHTNFSFQILLSRGDEAALPPKWLNARVTDICSSTVLAGTEHVLIAGSPSFVNACAEAATVAGLPQEAIHTEAYESRALPTRTT